MADVTYGDPRLPDRYWAKVYPCPITGCWLWGGAHKKAGYGNSYLDGRIQSTHRVMFGVANGYLPEHVCHSCDTPPCVNPDHLFPGNAVINNADAKRKGRNARGGRARAAVLTDELAAAIIMLKNTDVPQHEIAARYGVTQTAVCAIWAGGSWVHLHRDPVLAAKIAEATRPARPPACGRGHLFTPATTRIRPNGTRNCKVCAADDGRRRRHAA